MAAALCLLTEEQLLCPVCDDVFTDPVSTPCGHNFCRDCVSAGSVSVDAPLRCPACLRMFYPRPELQVNALIAGMVQQFRRTAPGGGSRTTGIFCVAWIWFLVFSFLIQPRLRWAEEAAGEKLEGSVRGVIVDLQLKVEEVKRLVEVKVKELPQVEQMIDGVLLRAELMRVRRYAVDLTLDPDAAHSDLILSPDGKQVKRRQSKVCVPEKPERFGFSVFVLVKQSFSSGRFYFEVQVQDKTDWTLGVAKESVCRKKEGKLSPRSGYWSISLSSRSELRALADPPVHLPLRWAPEKVGVFVDYEEGLVFFYDAESAAFIFSFTGIFFTERLYPFFDPGLNEDGRNSASLVLSSVGQTE